MFGRSFRCAFVLFLCGCGGIAHVSDDGGTPGDATTGAVPGLPSECLVGTALACDCDGAPPGFRFCLAEDGVFGECECAPPTTPAPELDGGTPTVDDGGTGGDAGASSESCVPGDAEWCDGRDNDCDALVDEEHVCPDATVAHTLPHELVVWLRGVRTPTDERSRGLQRFWPEPGEAIIPVPEAQQLRFDPTGALFFFRYGVGVRRSVGGATNAEASTPPCFDGVRALYGFDASSRMHYRCGESIRRGEGELVLEGAPYVTHVYPSGRLLLASFDTLSVIDADGTELGAFDPAEWQGTMRILGMPVIVDGAAFVAMNRAYRGETRREIVVFRADDDGSIRLVRRIPTSWAMTAGVALPDGTFVGLRTRSEDYSGVAFLFPTSGAATVIRRDSPERELHFDVRFADDGLVAGPASIRE